MKRRRHVPRLAVFLLCFSLVPLAASDVLAQSTASAERVAEGALSGVVRDSSGAVIPRPTIVVHQDPSGLERVINGAGVGTFLVPQLAPRRYVITVSALGFAVATHVIDAPSAEPLNITLTPAPIVEQVTVISASRQEELRDTLNTRVDVITRRRIEETGGQETVAWAEPPIPEVRTVVHLHGHKVLPDSDGYPEAWFTNGFAQTGPLSFTATSLNTRTTK
jgi:hypothetical protein